ncbi:MAG: tRNA (N6-isopentenyl adenosine(37)-C2)-methylthiotransferase MiaB [Deltaproteobacteria bacterium]|nr:MAG: tRNA (N6-isopentenyl adenosine(37)-C2)-methylthiotransferase MiaB [Deltaproteobacteria bacterium]
MQKEIKHVEATESSTNSSVAASDKQRGVYVRTFGCQMNVHDSHKILQLLSREGYQPVQTPEEADVILVNTCSVREKPEHKVLSTVGSFRELKENNPELVIGVGGCFARQEGDVLLRKAPLADLIFGPDNIPELPGMLQRLYEKRKPVVEVAFDKADDVRFLDVEPQAGSSDLTAMVTIMKGCDKYCSFCIVPYVRGRERYRSAHEIVEEVERLCSNGVREVQLLGQSVTSYRWQDGEETWELARLLRAVDKVPGLERLRFTSPYPRDFKPELVACYDGSVPTLCEHVHLPFQSGSNEILYRMNRRHTREQYFEWVANLRKISPNITVTSDVIVGFPGETEEDFAQTLDLIEQVRFDQLYSYKYSPRPRTPARKKEQFTEEEKTDRLYRLQDLQNRISKEKNEALVGTIQEVLVEGPSRKGGGQLTGRSRGNKSVNFLGNPALIGSLVNVKITEGFHNSLMGDCLGAVEKDAQ